MKDAFGVDRDVAKAYEPLGYALRARTGLEVARRASSVHRAAPKKLPRNPITRRLDDYVQGRWGNTIMMR